MKKKMSFIMPRLIGATLVAGLAAFIVTTLFKLLLGVTLLAGAITLVARKVGSSRRKWMARYGQQPMPGFANRNAFANDNPWANNIQPIKNYATQKGTSIVPIN